MIQKTEAFVLKTFPFRSSSLIVTFYTRDFGKVKGIAKGVRQECQTRGALFELFTRLDIVFYEKSRSDLHLVSESSVIESHDNLRARFDGIAYASYFSELVDVLTEIHDPHQEIFNLLAFCFRFLPSVPGERLSRLFEIKLLHAIGWLPYSEGCPQCKNAGFEQGFFSISQGALFCKRCASGYEDASRLSPQALQLLRYYARHDLEEGMKARATPNAERELGVLMERFLLYRLPAPLKSRQFMASTKLAMA